jgi:superfamily II DNA/RNA helicase
MLALVQVRFFVLDEADRLVDHLEEVMTLFKRLPKAGVGIDRLQVWLGG